MARAAEREPARAATPAARAATPTRPGDDAPAAASRPARASRAATTSAGDAPARPRRGAAPERASSSSREQPTVSIRRAAPPRPGWRAAGAAPVSRRDLERVAAREASARRRAAAEGGTTRAGGPARTAPTREDDAPRTFRDATNTDAKQRVLMSAGAGIKTADATTHEKQTTPPSSSLLPPSRAGASETARVRDRPGLTAAARASAVSLHRAAADRVPTGAHRVPTTLGVAACETCGARAFSNMSREERGAGKKKAKAKARPSDFAAPAVSVLGAGARRRTLRDDPARMAKRTGGGGGGGGGGEVGDYSGDSVEGGDGKNAHARAAGGEDHQKNQTPSKQRPSKVTAFAPCARCGAAWYCSDACAAEDWDGHRRVCRGMRRGWGGGEVIGDALGFVRGERAEAEGGRRDAFLCASIPRGR